MTDQPPRPELPPQRDLIDGRWVAPSVVRTDAQGRPLQIEHASTGRPVQEQRASDADAIEAALAASWSVHDSGSWSSMPADARADLLDAMADHLEGEVPRVAELESITSGAVVSTTAMLGFILHGAFRLAAQQLRDGLLSRRLDGPTGHEVEIDRVPWGPALLLCPWNAPAPMAAHKAASALAAGAPVIIKPPERAPHGTAVIGEAAVAAGLPAGVVQILHGGPEVATVLLADRRIGSVSFTGGLVGGRAVAHACAEGLKPAQLELGGHGPLVVLDDTDPADAAAAVTSLLTTLNGQWCRALGRVLLPESRADEYLEAIRASLAEVVIGDPLDERSQMGPMVHSEHLSMLRARVDELVEAGATVISPARLPEAPGNWMGPTLLDGLDPELTTDEIFGPVASVHRYSWPEDAIELANGTDYGLEAYVLGGDVDRAMQVARRIRAGEVKVNGASPMNLHLMAPRPAFGLSGMHDEGTVETIEFFAGNRVVGIEGSIGS
jgi:acyl-CoA reductase-like NAD-dependent aldehyde dehydrogenase